MKSEWTERVDSDAFLIGAVILIGAFALVSGFRWGADALKIAEQHAGLIAAVTFFGVFVQIAIANRQLRLARLELKAVEKDLRNSEIVTGVVLKQQEESERRAILRLTSELTGHYGIQHFFAVTIHNDGDRTATAMNIELYFSKGISVAQVIVPGTSQAVTQTFSDIHAGLKAPPVPVAIRDKYFFPKSPILLFTLELQTPNPVPEPAVYWRLVYEDGITPPIGVGPIVLF